MATLQEILARAQALREETALGSISPERAGSIMYDTLQQINQMQLEGGSLVISKIYESVAAMQADTAPVSDLTGQDLRQGQLVVIVPSDTSSSDLGSVYRYNGTTEGASSWSFTGKIGGYPMDQTPTQGSTRAVTSGGVYEQITQLGQKVDGLDVNVGTWSVGTVNNPSGGHIPDYSSNRRMRTAELTIPLTAKYFFKVNSGYKFGLIVVGKRETLIWDSTLSIDLQQGDVYRIVLREDPDPSDTNIYSGWTQEQIDALIALSGFEMFAKSSFDELKEELEHEVSREVGIVSDSYAETLNSGNANHKVIDGLNIQTGETFFVTLSGTTEATRIIIRYNVGTGNNLKDNVVIGETYEFVAPADINSLWIWYNGSVDITMQVDVSISAQTKILTKNVEELLPVVTDVNVLTKEVFDQETTLIDLTSGSYEQSIDFFVPIGKEVTIKVESLSAQDVSIYASDYLNNTIETIHSGSLSDGQVVEDTFTPEKNVYKIRFVASTRGKMNVTTIGESIRESLASAEGSVGTRLTGVESVVYGAEQATTVDVREYDLNNDGIDVPIVGGNAYSLVKFKIDNSANSVGAQCRLYYLSTSYKELGLLYAPDKGVREVIYEIPEDFVGVRYAAYNTQKVTIQIITELDPKVTGNISETAISSNVLNPSSLVVGKDMKPDGTEIIDTGRAYTDFIKVKEGDIVVLSNDVETLAQVNSTGRIINPRPLNMRFVAVYDYNKNILPELAPDSTINHQRYVVPNGVYYIRVSANISYLTGEGARINLGGVILPYEPYWVGTRPAGVTDNERSIAKIKIFPVSEMPDYLRNIVSYKPLGQLSKGYLCVSDDDGTIGLGTYTLPMVLQKDVPVTFGVMKDSAIFQEGNEQYKALLLDAVNNHNCTIAQHGGVDWTEYNEMQLFEFFNREKTYWDSLGVEVKAAAIPSHKTDKIIESVAGGYFGVVRCGYEGYDASYVPSYETIHTDNYACIPRTNMFCLPSLNVRDKTLQGWMDIIDWAVENKLLINVYFHDIDFVETADDYMARRALLEGFLDYAKGHITMINLEDIPKLV